MGYIRLEKDSDGIVELIFDQPGKTVNTMGQEYDEAMRVRQCRALAAGVNACGAAASCAGAATVSAFSEQPV